MLHNALILLVLLMGLHTTSALTATNARMHVTTTKFCNKDLKDQNGDPAPCGVSMAKETYGLTLPGMEDGTLTTKEDVIVTQEGQVTVMASPNRPYQYMMSVEAPTYRTVEQIFRNQAFTVLEELHQDTSRILADAGKSQDLEKDGWHNGGVVDLDGSKYTKWSRQGPTGVDPKDGTNYTALYETGVQPDTWVLYTDEGANKPHKLLAINTFKGDKVFQESTIEKWEDFQQSVSITDATTEMYSTYNVQSSRRLESSEMKLVAPAVEATLIDVDFLPEAGRAFFEQDSDYDWMNHRALRSGAVSFQGIDYFTIEKGSAADRFFHAGASRSLVQALKFEFPNSCRDKDGQQVGKYCLYVSVDASLDISVKVEAGMTFVDVSNPDITAHLKLTCSLKKDGDQAVLDLSFEARGCAVVFQLGEGFSLSINICITGSASGNSLLQPDKRSFSGSVEVKVSFNVNVPVVGSIIHWAITAKLSVTVKPQNDITAFGSIGTDISLWIAGAGVSLDIKGNSVDHIANKWEFVSGVNFNAWIKILFWGKSWNHRWEIWHAGPVTF